MAEKFDVIVAGCGPAGASAGHVLARQGARVAMLDKCDFPRGKLCGGALTWKAMAALEHVFGETAESLTQAGAINYVTDRYAFYHRNKLFSLGSAEDAFHFVERERLDAHLLAKAEQAGAVVRTGDGLAACDPSEGTVRTASGKEYQARLIIGADGVNSTVRRSFSINKKAWLHNLASTIEIHVNHGDLPFTVDKPSLYVGFVESGYGWVFPNRDKVIIGHGGLIRKNRDIAHSFRRFLDHLDLKNRKGIHLRGHLLPYGNYLERPVLGRAMLAGDAGGFVESLFGEGIFYAIKTGQYSALAAAEALENGADHRSAYVGLLERNVFAEMAYSNHFRRMLFYLYKKMGNIVFKWFWGGQPKMLIDMIHGKRSFRFLANKHWE